MRARSVALMGSCSKRPASKAAANEAEAYSEYVEALSDARTPLAVVFNSFLLVVLVFRVQHLLPLLLFHGVMQEHSDKHRIERGLFPASRLGEWRSCLP